jgi:hypothetical protein
MSPKSPVLPVILNSPCPPWVTYHNVLGIIGDDGVLKKVAGRGDGVIAFESAHVDDVASEVTVTSDHVNVHRHPRAVLEVARILVEHLDQLRAETRARSPQPVQFARPQPHRPTFR